MITVEVDNTKLRELPASEMPNLQQIKIQNSKVKFVHLRCCKQLQRVELDLAKMVIACDSVILKFDSVDAEFSSSPLDPAADQRKTNRFYSYA